MVFQTSKLSHLFVLLKKKNNCINFCLSKLEVPWARLHLDSRFQIHSYQLYILPQQYFHVDQQNWNTKLYFNLQLQLSNDHYSNDYLYEPIRSPFSSDVSSRLESFVSTLKEYEASLLGTSSPGSSLTLLLFSMLTALLSLLRSLLDFLLNFFTFLFLLVMLLAEKVALETLLVSSCLFSMTKPLSAPAEYFTSMVLPSELMKRYLPRMLPDDLIFSNRVLNSQTTFSLYL